MALDRKKVEGCARDAMRRIEVDDIGRGGCLEVVMRIFGELLRFDFRDQVREHKRSEVEPIALGLIGYVTWKYD